MKVNLKNLKGEVFSVEVDPQLTILHLKEQVSAIKGFTIEQQKIVFKGKTTNNHDSIASLGLKESDFLVVMTQVAKPAPKKVEEPVALVKEQSEAMKPAEKPIQHSLNKPEVNNEAQINQLMSMGFSREKCMEAFNAAYNNSERAVEYLINGIPGMGHERQHTSALSGLINHPQFEQIRERIRADPTNLEPILLQIASTNPEIYQLISEHPEEFQMLVLSAGEDEDQEDEYQEGSHPEGEIIVTESEEAAITRLAGLGFSKLEAAQAYLACDKNEELAANLLFDRLAMGDMEDEAEDEEGDDDNLFN